MTIKIFSMESEREHDRIPGTLDRLTSVLATVVNPLETVGLYADISFHGVLLVLAAVRLGLRVALCPLREPPLVIASWLGSLRINTLISSTKPLEEFSGKQFVVDDMIQYGSDKFNLVANNFSSIMRTSGSSKAPKNALITERAHWASARAVNEFFSFDSDSSFLLSLPLYHVSGMSIIFRALLADGSIAIARSHDDIAASIAQKKVTHISLVPTQLKRLLDQACDFRALSAVIIGGDALPARTRNQALDHGVPLYETYGLTETASMIWVRDARGGDARVLPHAIMERAQDGEILVGGTSLFEGYLTADGEISRPGPLFATGDLAIGGVGDQLQLINRKSNRIISGGENIQGEEVEYVLEQHPEVAEAVVVGVRDKNFGMRPRAYVRLRNDRIVFAEITSFLRVHLAAFKVPELVSWPVDAPVGLKKPRQFFRELVRASADTCHDQP